MGCQHSSVPEVPWEDVLEGLCTEEIGLAAVQRDGCALEDVPGGLDAAAEIYLAAVQQKEDVLQYVLKGLRTTEICLPAVQQNAHAQKYVPEGLHTKAICDAAVQQDVHALRNVPVGLAEAAEICLAAVQ